MTRATLADVLAPARDYAVPGLVCLGWEDMRAFTAAAEVECAPVILQAGPGCRRHTPLPVLAAMLGHLAEGTDVPVVIHLDHGASVEECRRAIDLGFTSVMHDGSADPLAKNVADTARVAEMAHAAGASCEGEVGLVGYAEGAASRATDPAEAARFAAETGVDALAVSVGNVHLRRDRGSKLDEGTIAAIRAATPVPLVIHGGSGVPEAQRAALAARGAIAKFNIGTELREVFGRALRDRLAEAPDAFDRIEILSATEEPMTHAARAILRNLGAAGRA